jgi:hypothetical protein
MYMAKRVLERRSASISCFAVIGITCIVLSGVPSWGRGRSEEVGSSPRLANSPDSRQDQPKIPPGTILPVRLRTTLDPKNLKQGQAIRGGIAQEVPLSGSTKIPKGSRVEGHVVAVTPAEHEAKARISIRFDKLYLHGEAIPITTNLRAIAGFMDVEEAVLPDSGPGEGDVARWLDTTQIGGDRVYGVGGPVTSAQDSSFVVGKSVNDGVLVRVRRKDGTKCRGPMDGNNNPQALWVFSSDACGVYGISNLYIVHAGRSEPVGTIVLEMQGHGAKIRGAAGMLLRVIG